MNYHSILFVPILLAIVACNRKGCTDHAAINYDHRAKKNYGCTYESGAFFYWNEQTATNLYNDGSDTLYFYVDGELVGSSSTQIYISENSSCGLNSVPWVAKDLGTVKSISCSYEVIDDSDSLMFSGFVEFSGNSCERIELVY